MGDPNFTVEELSAIAFGYNRLLEESSNLLLDLKEVTTATGLSMTDKERLDCSCDFPSYLSFPHGLLEMKRGYSSCPVIFYIQKVNAQS